MTKKMRTKSVSLYDNPTLTPNIFNAGFNALLIYQNMLHEKEKCPKLCLHDKPTLIYTSSSWLLWVIGPSLDHLLPMFIVLYCS